MENSILITLIIAVAFLSCKKEYAETQIDTVKTIKKVKAQPLKLTDNRVPLIASGVLASEAEMYLAFKVGGIVQKLYVDEGQTVRKGQLLATLDLTEIKAQVNQAENNYKKTKRDLERVNRLYADSAATLEQKQDLETTFEIAKEALKIARFNLRYARIIAPLNARVLDRMVEGNEIVSPGQSIFRLGSTGQAGEQLIRVGVSDEYVVKISLMDSANVYFDPFPDKAYQSAVTEISEGANPATGLFEVELKLEGYHPELKNGFIGKLKIYPSKDQQGFKIPMIALIEGNGDTARVYHSPDGKTALQKSVKVAQILNDHFIVRKNALPPEGWIITEGASFLDENDSITIIN